MKQQLVINGICTEERGGKVMTATNEAVIVIMVLGIAPRCVLWIIMNLS